MTKVQFKKASGPLSEYAEKARKDPIIVIKHGKPFAAVIPIRNAAAPQRQMFSKSLVSQANSENVL